MSTPKPSPGPRLIRSLRALYDALVRRKNDVRVHEARLSHQELMELASRPDLKPSASWWDEPDSWPSRGA